MNNSYEEACPPCVLCFDRDGDHVLFPCGHKHMCLSCVTRLPYNRCPHCRNDIKGVHSPSFEGLVPYSVLRNHRVVCENEILSTVIQILFIGSARCDKQKVIRKIQEEFTHNHVSEKQGMTLRFRANANVHGVFLRLQALHSQSPPSNDYQLIELLEDIEKHAANIVVVCESALTPNFRQVFQKWGASMKNALKARVVFLLTPDRERGLKATTQELKEYDTEPPNVNVPRIMQHSRGPRTTKIHFYSTFKHLQRRSGCLTSKTTCCRPFCENRFGNGRYRTIRELGMALAKIGESARTRFGPPLM